MLMDLYGNAKRRTIEVIELILDYQDDHKHNDNPTKEAAKEYYEKRGCVVLNTWTLGHGTGGFQDLFKDILPKTQYENHRDYFWESHAKDAGPDFPLVYHIASKTLFRVEIKKEDGWRKKQMWWQDPFKLPYHLVLVGNKNEVKM